MMRRACDYGQKLKTEVVNTKRIPWRSQAIFLRYADHAVVRRCKYGFMDFITRKSVSVH
jgi:hypothetical protein